MTVGWVWKFDVFVLQTCYVISGEIYLFNKSKILGSNTYTLYILQQIYGIKWMKRFEQILIWTCIKSDRISKGLFYVDIWILVLIIR